MRALVVAAFVCAVSACSAGSTVGGGDAGLDAAGGDGGVTPNVGSCTASYPVSQPLSAPCCPDRGADACGAGLFCAAFDGRTQPTCYAEHSRSDGATCTADMQCQSSSCHPATGTCGPSSPPPGCTDPAGCGDASMPPPPVGMCPATCTTNAQCETSCPKAGNYVQCCDAATQRCYATAQTTCP